ncbi:type II toxin-antitoxin system death-on-curing family toxin [Novosphingobium sp. KACC 22771]|uniref:type II toxin-antitoxin system death-on-curing family toxin n=1 Tax=Novosphingobium sp. KACC 22771 TaxID=3025670 RepID=UPI0023668D20|nr:type II toxin-antitoxin system death-on-curing family toxin [Novosphingobium sp. KACC 22771]WDF71342.1 type II toxin-antitoxin system death-on-curing family toxin [Novosphingobium sp. KACC 22771]
MGIERIVTQFRRIIATTGSTADVIAAMADVTQWLGFRHFAISHHVDRAAWGKAMALESALGRPRNQWAYGEADLCALAAAYAYGVARNYPFTDGNKRTAWVLARLFLALNEVQISFTPAEAVHMVLALSSGTLAEPEVARWFKARLL